jgi:ribonuclease P protein component
MTSDHPPREADGVRLPDSEGREAAIGRVKARRDFLAANAGFRVPTPAFILLVHPTDLGVARAGFTVTKRIGNAVQRNRARRRLREAARLAMPGAAVPSADHIFIARPLDLERPFADLLRDTRGALGKAARKLAGA